MKTIISTLTARTPVHVGAGNSVGVVDSPIMRERHTSIPIIPGSSLKGVLADFWNDNGERTVEGEWLFGSESNDAASAGALLIGEARVLLFPVRSGRGGFSWITCPLALSRFSRDTGIKINIQELSGSDKCFGGSAVTLNDQVILEEYVLASQGEFDSQLENLLQDYLPSEVRELAAGRIALVSDEIFSYFCQHACEVITRINIDNETGTVKNGALFNQEQAPSETVFYTALMAQSGKGNAKGRTAEEALSALQEGISKNKNLIQVGGHETIGLGFCSVVIKEV